MCRNLTYVLSGARSCPARQVCQVWVGGLVKGFTLTIPLNHRAPEAQVGTFSSPIGMGLKSLGAILTCDHFLSPSFYLVTL